jgi:hypothetical protein
MEENRKVYIYGLIDPRNDKVFYAGFTNNIKRRYNSHMNINGKKREKNTHKDNVIKKIFALGLKPEIKIIDECDYVFNGECNLYEHERLEIFYIKKYRDNGFKLTNLTNGGEGSRNILSLKKVYQYSEDGVFLKEYNSILDFTNSYNIKPTAITYVIDQKRHKTYKSTYLFSSHEKVKNFKFKKSLKHTTPILQYSLSGEFICEFESQAEAFRKTNILQSGINLCLKKKCKQFKGYYWFYKNEMPKNMDHYDGRYSTMVKPIYQYDLDNNLINEFYSISEASRQLNISTGWIVMNLKKNSKSCKNFIFKYKNN